jgi:hypothetical protein
MLAEDISLRVKTQQMGFDKLLPASYLNGERWNDEKPNGAPQISASANAIGGTGLPGSQNQVTVRLRYLSARQPLTA